MPAPASSLAYIAVTMFNAALDTGYGTDAGIAHIGLAWSQAKVIEPTSEETLTMRAPRARRSSGSIAFVTAMTPRTLVSSIARRPSSGVALGAPPMDAMPALLTRTSR